LWAGNFIYRRSYVQDSMQINSESSWSDLRTSVATTSIHNIW
jgi:hypothetical protein